MARLLRGYPSRQSGVHNARILSPKFLPTGVRVQVAVRQSLDLTRRSLRNATKLRAPAVVTPAPVSLFLPRGARSPIVVVWRSFDARRSFRTATRLYPPQVIGPPAPAFLPTLARTQFAIPRAALAPQLFPRSTKLRPPAVVSPAIIPPPFLPTGVHANVAVRSHLSLPATHSRLRPPTAITPLPTTIFLPTGPKMLAAVRRAAQSSRLQPRSTKLRNSLVTTTSSSSSKATFFMFF